jgi:hypothetical protein
MLLLGLGLVGLVGVGRKFKKINQDKFQKTEGRVN